MALSDTKALLAQRPRHVVVGEQRCVVAPQNAADELDIYVRKLSGSFGAQLAQVPC